MSVVRDASALIAVLKGERGAAKVAAVIADARVSSVNYAEVVSHFVHAGMPQRDFDAMLDPLPMTMIPADKALVQLAGRLRGVTAEGVPARRADKRSGIRRYSAPRGPVNSPRASGVMTMPGLRQLTLARRSPHRTASAETRRALARFES